MTEIVWQKSSYSGSGDGNSCVELSSAHTPGAIALRESDDPTAVLLTRPAQLVTLLRHLKSGASTRPSARGQRGS